MITLTFFCKQQIYKQLTPGLQITKHLSDNKNYRLKKGEFFLCNKIKKVVN